MGNPNSRRARRRHRGRFRQFYANHVWLGGQWLIRTVEPTRRIDLGGGRWFDTGGGETWNPPEVLALSRANHSR